MAKHPDQKTHTPASTATPRRKHVPQRTCVACRRHDTKRALLRLVRVSDGRVELDPTGKRNGRGAYVCLDPACWELALKRRSIERALRIEELHPDDRATLTRFMRELETSSASNSPDTHNERVA